jgi:thioredoxin 1
MNEIHCAAIASWRYRLMMAQGMASLREHLSDRLDHCPIVGLGRRVAKMLEASITRLHAQRTMAREDDPSLSTTISMNHSTERTNTIMAPTTLTTTNFAKYVENAQGVTLVDFWASWCFPCRRVAPVIEQLAEEYAGKATIGKLNVDEHGEIAARYNITGIPTVGIFRDGKLVDRIVGARPHEVYQQSLNKALAPAEKPSVSKNKSAQHAVTVFSTPTCPWCTRLKNHLRDHHIAYKDIDVSRDTSAAQEMVLRSGQMGVPQTWIDDEVIVGFDRKRIDILLGLTANMA